MVGDVANDLWLQSRRIGLAKGRIAALDDIRLRLIEMGDCAGANAVAALVDRLRRDLEYQTQVRVAMEARAAVTRAEHPMGAEADPAQRLNDLGSSVDWREMVPSAPGADWAAEAA
jgi:hypothetical protein